VNYDIGNPKTPIGVASKGGKATVTEVVDHRLGLGGG
jgi:hypothetical protein